MDIALAILDLLNNELHFSGAYNPLYIIRQNNLIELQPNRMPIGVHSVYQDTGFSVQKMPVKTDDRLYFFSDGYFDQFGGREGNKFGKQAFKNLLLDIHQQSMQDQKNHLDHTLQNWMNDSWPQIDDIMVLGFRVTKNEFNQ